MKKIAIVLTFVVAVTALGGTYYFKQLKPQIEASSSGTTGKSFSPSYILDHDAHH